MNSTVHTLPRNERLRSKKKIARLFDRNSGGNRVIPAYPYRVVLYPEPDMPAGFPEILVSVPKRNFKKAVQRNRIKRLTREAYRLQKTACSTKMCIAFLYVGKEVPEYSEVERAIGQVLDKLGRL